MIDLSLSAEQREIVESAAELLREQAPVSRLRPGARPVDVHRLLAQWGWFGVGLPEEAGGLNLGLAEEALLYMEAGRFLLSPGVLATTLAARMAQTGLREALLAGERRAAMALPAGEDGWYCFDRGDAEVLVTLDGDRASLFPAAAFHGELVAGLDETVVMERGRLDLDQGLGAWPGSRAVLLTTAMLAGVARASCDLAVEYAKVREQFGQPIGAFQAIKHRCADMAMRAYAAEAQLMLAAASASDTPASAPFQITAAACTAIAAARANGAAAIQVHGGMGFTAECEAHLFLKRAHLLSRLIGGLEAQESWLLGCPAPEKG
jgi:alkylation response protein AidB-like acyl-CoA dehydrogenase